MQDCIPEEVLPPKELVTDLHLTEHMEDLYREATNITQDTIFSNTAANDDTAIISDAGTITYRELRKKINGLAQLLLNEGVSEGERVLIQFANEPRFHIANFALQKINAVPIPVSPMNTEEDIAYMADDARATWAITTDEHANQYASLDITVLTPPFPATGKDLEPRGEPDDMALLLYSSGTTGNPKGTIKTHQELLADGEVMAKAFDLQPDDVIGGTAPVSFAMGYLVFALTAFRYGAAVSITNQRDPNTLAERIEQDNITLFSAVPTSYNKILDALEGEHPDFSSLRICMTGGEELKRHTYDRWKQAFGLTLDNHYGCTELLTIALYQPPNADMTPTHNGVPPEDMDTTLFGEKDEGELAVKGPVQVRYWNNNEVQRDSVQDGYFLLGDIFQRDDRGEYNFKCRKDNLIVTSGYKVSANEVENVLLNHPKVAEAAVIGMPDDTRGQRVKAFVVAEDELQDARGRGELQGYVKASIAPYKYPREIEFLPEIPKTDIGKVDRKALQNN